MASDWMVWQLIDTSFPSGGFVHSGGLEVAAQAGVVFDNATLEQYVVEQLNQTANTTLKLMTSCYKALDKVHSQPFSMRLAAFEEMDTLAQAMTTNHVANRASRSQGLALLSTAASCLAEKELTEYKRAIYFSSSSLYGHYPPVFGLVSRTLGLPLETAQRMFMFFMLRTLISSAVRLNLAGPMEGQRMQVRCSKYAEFLLSSCDTKEETQQGSGGFGGDCRLSMKSEVDLEAVTVPTESANKQVLSLPPDHGFYQTSPLLDLVQGMHDRLQSRLFNT
jgi:urease accessory protein